MNQVLLYKVDSKTSYDITTLTNEKKWSGSVSSAARTLLFSFLTTGGVDVNVGDFIYFKLDDVEVFRGVVLTRGKDIKGIRPLKIVDLMHYWAKSKDTFTFHKKAAHTIFSEVANRFKIATGRIDPTGYTILDQVNPNHSPYDVMKMCLDTTYKQTGVKFTMRDVAGKACLLNQNKQVHTWIMEEKSNIIDYTYSESMENMFTAVKLTTQVGNKSYTIELKNDKLIAQYGYLQYFEKLDDKMTKAQAEAQAKVLLKDNGILQRELSINGIGVNDVLSGDAIFIKIPSLGIGKIYYVESDDHSIKGNMHTMSLKLSESKNFGGV